jgi:hypothetical protein
LEINVAELLHLAESGIPFQTGVSAHLSRKEGEPAEVTVILTSNIFEAILIGVSSEF